MGVSSLSSILSLLLPFLVVFSFLSTTSCAANTSSVHGDFLQCLNSSSPSIHIHTPTSFNFTNLFRSSARNLRFLTPNATKPEFIITPTHESHIQTAIICCKQYNLDLKVRSGGHDVEGQSYVSDNPFVIVDLIGFRNITIDVESKTAWIQAGASLGEVYYAVGNKSNTLGFPAGFCPTVGTGGHIGGGGFGGLVRKYGLSSDQVIDARFINANGQILDQQTMGKDLFWAIRGGGVSNFGVIVAWKVKLVDVTPIVTVASVTRALEQGATDLVHRWQFVAHKLEKDIYVGLTIVQGNGSRPGQKTVIASFSVLFLGRVDRLLQLMGKSFPELGLGRNDCTEMSWVQSHVYFFSPGRTIEFLWDRDHLTKSFLKIKTDYVRTPISKAGLEGIWKMYMTGDSPAMMWTPTGGRMNEIAEFETPYPHRAGNIYNIMYVGNWLQEDNSEKQMEWMRKFYTYMTPFVSKNPRSAYVNYKDLDLGQNMKNDSAAMAYIRARSWGKKYFKGNFERLVKVKSMVDPDNFFKNQQSIPSIRS